MILISEYIITKNTSQVQPDLIAGKPVSFWNRLLEQDAPVKKEPIQPVPSRLPSEKLSELRSMFKCPNNVQPVVRSALFSSLSEILPKLNPQDSRDLLVHIISNGKYGLYFALDAASLVIQLPDAVKNENLWKSMASLINLTARSSRTEGLTLISLLKTFPCEYVDMISPNVWSEIASLRNSHIGNFFLIQIKEFSPIFRSHLTHAIMVKEFNKNEEYALSLFCDLFSKNFSIKDKIDYFVEFSKSDIPQIVLESGLYLEAISEQHDTADMWEKYYSGFFEKLNKGSLANSWGKVPKFIFGLPAKYQTSKLHKIAIRALEDELIRFDPKESQPLHIIELTAAIAFISDSQKRDEYYKRAVILIEKEINAETNWKNCTKLLGLKNPIRAIAYLPVKYHSQKLVDAVTKWIKHTDSYKKDNYDTVVQTLYHLPLSFKDKIDVSSLPANVREKIISERKILYGTTNLS